MKRKLIFLTLILMLVIAFSAVSNADTNKASNLTYNEGILSWDEPSNVESFTYCYLYVYIKDTDYSLTSISSNAVGGNSADLSTDLAPGITYTIEIQYDDEEEYVTELTVPGDAPTEIDLTAELNENTQKISWNTPTYWNSFYLVKEKKVNNVYQLVENEYIGWSSQSWTISGDESGEYRAKVIYFIGEVGSTGNKTYLVTGESNWVEYEVVKLSNLDCYVDSNGTVYLKKVSNSTYIYYTAFDDDNNWLDSSSKYFSDMEYNAKAEYPYSFEIDHKEYTKGEAYSISIGCSSEKYPYVSSDLIDVNFTYNGKPLSRVDINFNRSEVTNLDIVDLSSDLTVSGTDSINILEKKLYKYNPSTKDYVEVHDGDIYGYGKFRYEFIVKTGYDTLTNFNLTSSTKYYINGSQITGSNLGEFLNNLEIDGTTQIKIYQYFVVVDKTLNITQGSNSACLNWTDLGATSYDIYRATSLKGKYSKVASISTNSYTDLKATFGYTYYYKVYVADLDIYLDINSVTPGFVENLNKSSITASGVKLTWTKLSSATGYYLYRKVGTGSYKLIKTFSKNSYTSFSDSKLSANTTYTYKIVPYKTISGKKKYGSESEITILTAPTTPTFTISNSDTYNALKLTIKKVPGAETYTIYRGTTTKNITTVVGNIAEFSDPTYEFVDSSLELDKTYYYRIVSENSEGTKSAYSKTLSKKLTLQTPTNFTVGSVITWDIVPGATKYEILRSTDKYFKANKTTFTVTENSYTDTGNAYGKTYYYKVIAIREDDKTYKSSYTSYKTYCFKLKDPKPTISYSDINDVTISYYNEPGLDHVVIERTTDKKFKKGITTVTISAEDLNGTYHDLTAIYGKTYYYRVKSYINYHGGTGYITSSIKTYKHVMPSISLTTTKKFGVENPIINIKATVPGNNTYRLEWYSSSKYTGTPIILDEIDELDYDYELVSGYGKTYYLKVVAYSNLDTTKKVEKKFTVKYVFNTPTLSLVAGSRKVNVTVTDTDEELIDGYEVYRATSKSGRYTLISDLEDTGLTKGKYYYYKARVYREVDGVKYYSSYSTIKYVKVK